MSWDDTLLRATKERSLLAGSAVYLLSNILNAVIPFILLPVLTRYLSPAEYGKVAMFQTLLGALAAFVGVNVVSAAGRKYYDTLNASSELKDYIAACLQILLASSLLALVIVFALRDRLTSWLSLETHWILIAVPATAAGVAINLRLVQWQVRKEAGPYGALQVSQGLVNMALSLVLVVGLARGAAGRIEGQVWSAAVFAVIALWLLHRDRLLGLAWNPTHIRESLRFGIPLIPHIAGGFLLTAVDRFVINAELGLAEAGVYMSAVQLSSGLTLLFDAINKAYVPWLFERLKRDSTEEKYRIVRYTYAWYGVILVGVALTFVFGPWLVATIAGEQYEQAGAVLGWLALGRGFGGMYLMVTNYVFYSKRTGWLSFVTITSGLLNVVLLVALTGFMGLKGAAIAFSLSMALRFLLTWRVAQARHPMPWLSAVIAGRQA